MDHKSAMFRWKCLLSTWCKIAIHKFSVQIIFPLPKRIVIVHLWLNLWNFRSNFAFATLLRSVWYSNALTFLSSVWFFEYFRCEKQLFWLKFCVLQIVDGIQYNHEVFNLWKTNSNFESVERCFCFNRKIDWWSLMICSLDRKQ